MRIVFVDNLLLEDKGGTPDYVLQPHLGLISLVAVAESAGHEGLLYDPKLAIARGELQLDEDLYRGIASEIARMRPDVVGLTTLGCNFICTLKIAGHLKRLDPNLPILLGGPHATVLDQVIIDRYRQFDVIVRNEAELKILPLLDALPSGQLDGVPGITFLRGSRVVVNPGDPIVERLDELPVGAYHCYPIKDLKVDWLRVDAGRGCPFGCTFCSTASFFGRRYRLKSAGRLVSEFEYLRTEFGASSFSLTHDLFTANRKMVVEFCEAVAGRGFLWKCAARMDCVDPELLEMMYGAGCRNVYYGIETGSTRMQRVTQKHLDLDLFNPILDATQNLGISATVSFIIGYPQEGKADQDATLNLAGSCYYRRSTLLDVQVHLLTPEPGTQLIHEFAPSLRYDGHITDSIFPTLEADDQDIMRDHPDIFMNHHYYPSSVSRARNIFVTEVFHVINGLGGPVMACVLEAHGRKMGVLMDRMEAWTTRSRGNVRPDADLFCQYCSEEFGADHILTSLVRNMVAAARAAGRLPAPAPHVALAPRPSRKGARQSLVPLAEHDTVLAYLSAGCPLDLVEDASTASVLGHDQVEQRARERRVMSRQPFPGLAPRFDRAVHRATEVASLDRILAAEEVIRDRSTEFARYSGYLAWQLAYAWTLRSTGDPGCPVAAADLCRAEASIDSAGDAMGRYLGLEDATLDPRAERVLSNSTPLVRMKLLGIAPTQRSRDWVAHVGAGNWYTQIPRLLHALSVYTSLLTHVGRVRSERLDHDTLAALADGVLPRLFALSCFDRRLDLTAVPDDDLDVDDPEAMGHFLETVDDAKDATVGVQTCRWSADLSLERRATLLDDVARVLVKIGLRDEG